MSTIFFGLMMSRVRDTHLRDSDDKFLKYTCVARNRGKFLDADNDDNSDDDDDDLSRSAITEGQVGVHHKRGWAPAPSSQSQSLERTRWVETLHWRGVEGDKEDIREKRRWRGKAQNIILISVWSWQHEKGSLLYLGNLSKRFSGFCPLRGGVPPNSVKEKNLLFFTLIFR